MTLMLSADELLTTTRSVRKRLDPDKPVPREVLVECLELAVQAPSGSNLQGWQWMFVEDTAKKKALADIYRAAFDNYLQLPRLEFEQGTTVATEWIGLSIPRPIWPTTSTRCR